MRRKFQHQNRIYFEKFNIIEFEKLVQSKESEFIWNSRFLIQEINGTLVNDNKGYGFKTRRRAYNVLKYNYKGNPTKCC